MALLEGKKIARTDTQGTKTAGYMSRDWKVYIHIYSRRLLKCIHLSSSTSIPIYVFIDQVSASAARLNSASLLPRLFFLHSYVGNPGTTCDHGIMQCADKGARAQRLLEQRLCSGCRPVIGVIIYACQSHGDRKLTQSAPVGSFSACH